MTHEHNPITVDPASPAPRRDPDQLSRNSLRRHFGRVMSDEDGQAAVEMAIMLAMLTGAIVFTNATFNLFLDDYIDSIMFFLKHP